MPCQSGFRFSLILSKIWLYITIRRNRYLDLQLLRRTNRVGNERLGDLPIWLTRD
jgi:hypothetical protein